MLPIREHCSKILQYYRVLDLKPQMPVPDVPMKYEKQVLKMNEDGEGMVGVGLMNSLRVFSLPC